MQLDLDRPNNIHQYTEMKVLKYYFLIGTSLLFFYLKEKQNISFKGF